MGSPGSGHGTLPLFGLALVATAAWTLVEHLGSMLPSRYSPLQVVWTRYAAHLLLLAILLGPRGTLRAARTRRPLAQLACSLTMLAMPACFVLALGSLDSSQVWAVFWTAPLMAMGLARVLLGDRASRRRWLAAAVGLPGAMLAVGIGRHWSTRGALLACAMAACFALYLVLARSLREEPIASKLLYTALGVWLALCVVVPGVWLRPTPTVLGALAGIGASGLVLLWALDRAVEAAPVSLVAPLVYTQTLWHLGGTVLTGHAPRARAMVGALVVVGAIAAVARERASPQQQGGIE